MLLLLLLLKLLFLLFSFNKNKYFNSLINKIILNIKINSLYILLKF